MRQLEQKVLTTSVFNACTSGVDKIALASGTDKIIGRATLAIKSDDIVKDGRQSVKRNQQFNNADTTAIDRSVFRTVD
jgi:hypothetical protein